MYYYIKGKVVYKDDNAVAIDANGIAYLINTTYTSIVSLGDAGTEVTMYTYLHVREDIMELYGFTTMEEKKMFILLLSVSGVGPKAALAILSVAEPQKIAAAVVCNDIKMITKASGVGPKLAQRVILELKDKLNAEDLELNEFEESIETVSDSKNEAVSALVSLGYSVNDAKNMVSKIAADLSVEEIIKKALMGF